MCLSASIHACQSTGRHILAFEEDKTIFDAVIAPLLRGAPLPIQAPPPPPEGPDLDDEEVPVQKIVKTS